MIETMSDIINIGVGILLGVAGMIILVVYYNIWKSNHDMSHNSLIREHEQKYHKEQIDAERLRIWKEYYDRVVKP